MSRRIAFAASRTEEAQSVLTALRAAHGEIKPQEAEVIVALGGDGFMLQTLHRYRDLGLPVYGMKLGSVGFLMNQFRPDDLCARIEQAHPTQLRPLEMTAVSESGATVEAIAFNEVALLRQSKQAAHACVLDRGGQARGTDLRRRAGVDGRGQHGLQSVVMRVGRQQVPELCEAELSCSRHGVCSPICETISDCPGFEGFDVACNSADYADLCIPRCNPDQECPKTGGVELHCSDFLCIGDP